MNPLRIFVSSPGDVADERELAHKLIEQLRRDPSFRHRAVIEAVTWDDRNAPTPMLAQLTPQQAVNRQLPKPPACDIAVVILWARMGTPLPPEYRKPDGTPYASGTEWEYEDALKGDPQPDILVYRRTEAPKISLEDPDDPKIQDALEQRRRVNSFFAHFINSDGSLSGGVATYRTQSEFIEHLESDLRHLTERRLQRVPAVEGAAGAGSVERSVRIWSGSPYPGLRAFTLDEAAIFFGRGREVDALIARLRDPAQRFLAVVGASGSGKSSLVRAGLLPRLKAGALEGSQLWPVVAFTPGASGDDPLLANRPAGTALVLFVDQLEELFTLVPTERQRAFVELLAYAADDARLRVLVTLRADFLPQSVNGAGPYRNVEEDEAYLRFVEAIEAIIAEEQQIYWQSRGSEPPAGQPKPAAPGDTVQKDV